MLTFITGNAGKFKEVAGVLPGIQQLELDLDEIQSLDPRVIIAHKLEQASQSHPGPFIVEDTSLEFNCLNGLPGTNIKWFTKRLSNEQLADLVGRYDDHGATARCIIGYRDSQGQTHFFEGSVTGTIVPPRGTKNVFGWNSIFLPNGQTETFAEMSIEAKNQLSMRGHAAQALLDYLNNQ